MQQIIQLYLSKSHWSDTRIDKDHLEVVVQYSQKLRASINKLTVLQLRSDHLTQRIVRHLQNRRVRALYRPSRNIVRLLCEISRLEFSGP